MALGSAADTRPRFGFPLALLVSVLVHVLFVLLSVWVPIGRGATALPPDEPDNAITFSFARDEEPTTDDPAEDAPFVPMEPAQSEPPTPAVTPPATDLPPLPVPEPVPASPVVDQPVEPETPSEVLEEIEPPGAELPERPDANARPSTARSPGTMQRALQDFGRAMANRPPLTGPSPPSTSTQQNLIAPDLANIPVSGFGVGNLEFESRDYDWTDYGRQIYMAIWRAWHNRLWMTTDDFEKWAHNEGNWRLHHATRVRFVIEDNGQVTGILVEQGSGCGPLDASAGDALAEVILPPLPSGFPRDREVVHATFIAEGPIRAMRPVLGRYKAMGLF